MTVWVVMLASSSRLLAVVRAQIVITPTCPSNQFSVGGTCYSCATYEAAFCTASAKYLQGCVSSITPGVCVSCALCPVSYYQTGCGSFSPGQCVSCTNKPASGYFYTSSGVATSACPYQACAPGTYTSSPSAIKCDSAAITPTCPSNQFSAGGTCYSCATYEAAFCTPNAQYLQGCVSSTTPGVCVSCIACPVSYYQTGCGSFSPGQCVACTNKPTSGYFYTSSNVATSACPYQACAPGTYTSSPSAIKCDSAGAGSYISLPSNVVLPCPVGTYSASVGVTSCANSCAPGTYGTGSGMTSAPTACPFACAAGTFGSATGASTCAQCAGGTYAASTGATACAACTLSCAAGKYQAGCGGASAGSCVGCPVGTSNPSSGATSAAACSQCGYGFYGTATGLAGCTLCGAGSYGNGRGLTACTLCPAGTYGEVPGMNDVVMACTACAAGSFGLVPGMTSSSNECALCSSLGAATGLFRTGCGGASAGVLSACTLCPLGQYNGACGGTSPGSCTACPTGTAGIQAGQFSVTAGCATCKSTCAIYGQWFPACSAGGSQCTWCANAAAGQYYGSSGSTTASCPFVNTPPGYYRPFANGYWPVSFFLVPASFSMFQWISDGDLVNEFRLTSMFYGPCFQNANGVSIMFNGQDTWYIGVGVCENAFVKGLFSPTNLLPSGDLDISAMINWNQPVGMVLPCPAGTYNPTTGATSADGCLLCPPGTYGAGTTQTSMSAGCPGICAAGTYSTTAGATDASTCVACGTGTYGTLAGAGSAASGCAQQCPPGTYGVLAGQTSLGAACSSCPASTWGNVTGAPSLAAGCPNACPSGTFASSQTRQTSQAGACTPCVACMPGTFTASFCGSLNSINQPAQTACGLVQLPYYAKYGTLQDTVLYSGAATPLVGMAPYQLIVPSAFSQQGVLGPGLSVRILSSVAYGTSPISPIPASYTLNAMLPCATPLPIGRVFVPWTPAVQTLSCTTCAGLVAQCDLKASTQCLGAVTARNAGGATALVGGYYLGPDNVACLPCTNASTTPPCGWGQYGNTSACSNVSNTLCAPCWGATALPANAQWTAPIAPYYFYGAPQCVWECNVGYYKNAGGTACVACYLPATAKFLPGDATGQNFVFLYSGGPSRLIGGSLAYGCLIECPNNTFVGYSLTGAGAYDPASLACLPCGAVACAIGQTLVYRINYCPTCEACNASLAPPANSDFYLPGSCATQCNAGYTLAAGGATCVACASTAPVCASGQYLRGCTPTVGPTCTACTASCGFGMYTNASCNLTSDRQCAPCPSSVVVLGGAVGPECRPYCPINYAYRNATSTCTACVTTPQNCRSDTLFVMCDGVNFGCAPCNITVPLPKPWCWTGVPGSCTWAYIGPGVTCVLMPPTTSTTTSLPTTTTTTATPTTTTTKMMTTTTTATTTTTTTSIPTTITTTVLMIPTTTTLAPTTTITNTTIPRVTDTTRGQNTLASYSSSFATTTMETTMQTMSSSAAETAAPSTSTTTTIEEVKNTSTTMWSALSSVVNTTANVSSGFLATMSPFSYSGSTSTPSTLTTTTPIPSTFLPFSSSLPIHTTVYTTLPSPPPQPTTTAAPEEAGNTTAAAPAGALSTVAVASIAGGVGVVAVAGTVLMFGGEIMHLFW